MATALKLRSDIAKIKKGLAVKGLNKSIRDNLEKQLKKAEEELDRMKQGGKPSKKYSSKGTQSALTKLQKFIDKPKYSVYKGKGVDLKKDASEPAFATGKRVSKGLKANQFGSKKENKGNTYYEYRVNRYDVKQPKSKQTYPKLEDGGSIPEGYHRMPDGTIMADSAHMAKGGIIEHGLKTGDKIISGKIVSGTTIIVRNESLNEDARIDLNTGKRTLIEFDKKTNKWVDKKVKKVYNVGDRVAYSKGGKWYKGNKENFKIGTIVKIDEIGDSRVKEYTIERRNKFDGTLLETFITDDTKEIDHILMADGGEMAKGGKMSNETIIKKTIVYDNGGDTIDRYTVFTPDGSVFGMSSDARGFNQYVGENDEIEKGEHLGKRLSKVPKEIEWAILDRMNYADGGEMAKGGEMKKEFLEDVGELHGSIKSLKLKDDSVISHDELMKAHIKDDEQMAKGGKLSLREFEKKYNQNEDENLHSENVVLLAENFGSADDIRDAKTILAKHDAIGHLPFSLGEERYKLSEKLWKKYTDMKLKKMSSGGKMAMGGSLIKSKEHKLSK